MQRPSGAAASSLVAPLIDGPVRTLRAINSGPSAHHLAVVSDDIGASTKSLVAICVITPNAVRLPNAVVVPTFPHGSPPLSVGDGLLRWDGFSVRVSRWWTPARPQNLAGIRSVAGRVTRDAATDLLDQLTQRLGRGPGLTPYADDVLCGALVALRAAGHCDASGVDAYGARLRDLDLEARTTAASAALIRLASQGWCVDALAAYITSPSPETREALLGVGHTSGAGLIEGVALAEQFLAGQTLAMEWVA